MSKEIQQGKEKEIRTILERGTFKLIFREETSLDANILRDRFVLAFKSTGDGQEKFKARYVLSGLLARYKHVTEHCAKTLQPQSVRVLLSGAKIFDFTVWTSDVR